MGDDARHEVSDTPGPSDQGPGGAAPAAPYRRFAHPSPASCSRCSSFLSPDLTLAPLSAGRAAARTGADRPARPACAADARPAPRPCRARPPSRRRSRSLPQVDAAPFEAAIAAAREVGGAYGITFAAVRDGQLVWSGAVGRQRDGVTTLLPDDPLLIGSVTKTFVAAAILQLVEEGRLSLDDSLRDHLPGMSSISRTITHPPAAGPHQRARRRVQRHHQGRARESSGARLDDGRGVRDAPRAVVPARRGMGVCQHELLPARPRHRAHHRLIVGR